MQIMHFVVTGKGPLRSSFQDKLAAAPLLHIQVSPLPKSATYPPGLTSQASLPLPYLLRLLSMHARVCLTEDVRAKRLLSIIARVCLCHLSHICLCHLSDIARHMNPWPSSSRRARARAHTHTHTHTNAWPSSSRRHLAPPPSPLHRLCIASPCLTRLVCMVCRCGRCGLRLRTTQPSWVVRTSAFPFIPPPPA
jgi:hypothetical protein